MAQNGKPGKLNRFSAQLYKNNKPEPTESDKFFLFLQKGENENKTNTFSGEANWKRIEVRMSMQENKTKHRGKSAAIQREEKEKCCLVWT